MPTAANVITYNNFIDGEWVPSVSGEIFENRNPANTDDLIGLFQQSTRPTCAGAVEAAAARLHGLAAGAGAAPRGDPVRAAQIIAERKDGLRPRHDARDGQGAQGDRGRRPGSDRHDHLMAGEGRRMYGQTVPSELRNKFAMSVRQPIGVCGDHHRLELPDGDPVLEDHPGAGLRQHRRVQAGRGRRCRRSTSSRCWTTPACRRASSTW